jgi:hypothetical protein
MQLSCHAIRSKNKEWLCLELFNRFYCRGLVGNKSGWVLKRVISLLSHTVDDKKLSL